MVAAGQVSIVCSLVFLSLRVCGVSGMLHRPPVVPVDVDVLMRGYFRCQAEGQYKPLTDKTYSLRDYHGRSQ